MLAGRVILVTGANGGLGAEAATACARAGATVALLGRKVQRLGRVHDAIVQVGGEAVLVPFDLEGASPDDHAQLAGRIGAELGRLDGLLHCAIDFTGLTPLQQTDPAAFARAVHVGVTARWWLTQACLPLLSSAPDGVVVFVVDDPGRTSAAFWGGYGVAQAGTVAMAAILAAELRGNGLRIETLRPPPMNTPLRARAYVADVATRAKDPAVIAQACVRLLAGDASDGRGPPG